MQLDFRKLQIKIMLFTNPKFLVLNISVRDNSSIEI